MSFILDALKKSEADRQEKASPGIADVPTAVSPSSAPRWLWIVVALLGFNLLVLMVVLLRPTEPERPSPVTTSTEPAPVVVEAAPQTSNETHSSGLQPAADDLESAMPDPEVAVASVPVSEPMARAGPEVVEPAPAEVPETETLLTFNDLRASGNVDLPDLHIDLHVYSDNPTERFVFINMNQYRERATLSEGPRVQRITMEGVILEYVGTTFLLPRE